MVNMLIEMFTINGKAFFSKAQVEGTLSSNASDFDKSMQSLSLKKEKLDKQGKVNINAKKSEKVEEFKAIEAIKQAKIDEEKKFNMKMNKRVEKDETLFQKVSKETMNKLYEDVDYGVAYDVEAAKKKINMAIIGHVDSGKSTLMGHLLTKLGHIDQR
jgi:polynucleotide 5'-kinase involved in rRNA processing